MNVSDFIQVLQHPEELNTDHFAALEKILDDYPYFQSARALYLKGLKDQDSFKYNSELKKTAAYTTDRRILFDFITSETFQQNIVAEKLFTHAVSQIDVADHEEIKLRDNETFGFKESDADAVLDPELFKPKDPTSKKKLKIGEPLDFNENEKHSFNEWLKLSSYTPIVREKTSTKKKKNPLKNKLDLIDKFIENNPKISPVKEFGNSANLAKENQVEKSELMTETLARVYLEQKKYKKAIQAYKILSLKYPEKSGFFADQINAIKKLQQQHN
ncbi:hypothetical protein SAMN04487906_0041 [Zhouia amylolytica]|uniref:Tetratricopeptide repeat-containing protein n=1 Tax=Zhouia amylolytica TaxID=376730 RepID=A0A1I6P089_9FLAO|nr:hypothetical protein [Zhouia amylolytica]MCQ0111678.1 hypothetical protein [Zhouia amylolytica]SFS33498.1 hypothetical protein SAMN04487906_0041 [Zhouia amylolytica]